MRPIKILQAIRQGKIGGGESHVLDLSTHLDRSKFEPVVLAFTAGEMVDELNSRGIQTKVIHTERAFDIRVWKQVSAFMKAQQIDIVHAHGTRANSNVFWAARHRKKPLLYTIHGWSFHQDQHFAVKKIRQLSERFLTAQAHQNICVSESNQNDGIKYCGMKHSTVINNAVDLAKFNPDRPFKNIRAELGIPASAKLIGFIVRMTKQKNPFTMLRAMKLIAEEDKNTILLMVGDGELKTETVKLAHELGIADRVIFQPFRKDVPDLLHAIDVYCLPSLWEGYPIGILEAMAMNKAVVVSPVDGTRELVQDGQTGLFANEFDHLQLSRTLRFILQNDSLRLQIAQNAMEFVKGQLSIDKLVNKVQLQYLKLYNQFNPQKQFTIAQTPFPSL